MTRSDTWLVVPLYNEAAVVGDVIKRALPTFPKIVCVDDGSSDDSKRVAEEAGAVVVRHPINLGQGAALQTGLLYALTDTAAEYFVTFDSDGQHRVDDARRMVERLEKAQPDTLAAAGRIAGITPAALASLLVHARRRIAA